MCTTNRFWRHITFHHFDCVFHFLSRVKVIENSQKVILSLISQFFQILQNGELLFMSDESEFSKAIIETTEKYSHVGIFFDGMLYHASRKRGVAKQKLEEYLVEEKHEVFIYRTRRLMQKSSRRGQRDI